MLKFAVIYTVMVTADIFFIGYGNCELQGLVQNILQSLQTQIRENESSTPRQHSSSSEEEVAHFGSLKKHDLEQSIPLQASESKNDDYRTAWAWLLNLMHNARKPDTPNKYLGNKQPELNFNKLPYFKNNDKKDNEHQERSIVESVISEEKYNGIGSLSDYSKVYVILNSDAVKSSRNLNKLNNLLSSLLPSPPSSSKKHSPPKRYKGFVINHHKRRTKEASSEKFLKMDDDSYNPMSNYGGGGGGGPPHPTRTAIWEHL